MSLLAAAVPVAVLVLAWDEATPAVRALVEATETTAPVLDSVVVLVPAAAGELTQEEFLPLDAEPAPLATAPSAESTQEEVGNKEEEEAVLPALPAVVPDLPPAEPAALPTIPAPSATPSAEPAASVIAVPAPLAWSAVRVLHLSSFSLPELTALSSQALPQPIWQRSVVSPAAPYLGSQSEVDGSQPDTLASPATEQPEALPLGSSLAAHILPSPFPTSSAAVPPEQPLPALPAPNYLAGEAPVPAFDAEADLGPIQPDELATKSNTPWEAPLAETSTNAQAGWSEALDSLRDPLPIDEPAPATDLEDEATHYAATVGESQPAAGAVPAELRPPSKPFEAPNLNFQVIQYARFAVPVALAQLPFAAIYAPAWPTWLAAQELRHRTRQPLVLHVATLAAGADESLATATSWQAELQRQALQRADLILAETSELAHRLRHDLGLPPELVRTVPAADANAVALALRTAQVRPSVSVS